MLAFSMQRLTSLITIREPRPTWPTYHRREEGEEGRREE